MWRQLDPGLFSVPGAAPHGLGLLSSGARSCPCGCLDIAGRDRACKAKSQLLDQRPRVVSPGPALTLPRPGAGARLARYREPPTKAATRPGGCALAAQQGGAGTATRSAGCARSSCAVLSWQSAAAASRYRVAVARAGRSPCAVSRKGRFGQVGQGDRRWRSSGRPFQLRAPGTRAHPRIRWVFGEQGGRSAPPSRHCSFLHVCQGVGGRRDHRRNWKSVGLLRVIRAMCSPAIRDGHLRMSGSTDVRRASCSGCAARHSSVFLAGRMVGQVDTHAHRQPSSSGAQPLVDLAFVLDQQRTCVVLSFIQPRRRPGGVAGLGARWRRNRPLGGDQRHVTRQNGRAFAWRAFGSSMLPMHRLDEVLG